jgi:microcystin-dependent protein
MPATPIQPLITDAGLAAAIAAQGTGLTLQITHVQLGTGAYALNFANGSPDYARTALVAPVEKNVIAGGYRDKNRFRVDVLFSPWGGAPATYGVSEIGFWAGDPDAGGVLFALWASPTVFAQRNMLTYLATFNLVLQRVASEALSVVIDPDLALALALVSDHEAAQDPHPRYRRHQFASTLEVSANRALTAAEGAGALVIIGGSGATVTLPPSADMVAGETVTLLVQGVNGVVARDGTDTISMGGSTGLSSVTLSASDGCELTYTGAGKWIVSGGSILNARTGEVVMVPATAPKAGTIKMNGAILSRTTFARLWAWAQASGNVAASDAAWAATPAMFSPGDGATTFRVPDSRGDFPRFWDDGRGRDAGRTMGSPQGDQNKAHGHTLTMNAVAPHVHPITVDAVGDHTHLDRIANTGGAGSDGKILQGSAGFTDTAGYTGAAGAHAHTASSSLAGGFTPTGSADSSGGTEVRVQNSAYLACIYY